MLTQTATEHMWSWRGDPSDDDDEDFTGATNDAMWQMRSATPTIATGGAPDSPRSPRSDVSDTLSLWEITSSRGCLPTAPVVASLAALAPAERLFAALPVLVRRPTDLRRRCEALPVVRLEPNADEALAERIFLIYGFLATAYLRPEGATSDDAGDVLPAPLAVPWAAAAARLDRAVGLDYASCVLANCSVEADGDEVRPSAAPLAFGSRDSHTTSEPRLPPASLQMAEMTEVAAGATFTGTADERYFYEMHARIEVAAAPALYAARLGS